MTDELAIDGTCPKCGSVNTDLVPSVGGYDAKCNDCDWTGSGDDYVMAGQEPSPEEQRARAQYAYETQHPERELEGGNNGEDRAT